MSGEKKTGDVRKKEFRLAIRRIQKGHTKEAKLSVAAVARVVGVSHALIQNSHKDIVAEIHKESGRTSGPQRNAKQQQLKAEREKNRALRAEIKIMRGQIAKLTSINEVLLAENRDLKARNCAPNVVDLGL